MNKKPDKRADFFNGFLIIRILLATLLSSGCEYSKGEIAEYKPAIGYQAPDFRWTNPKGQPVSLSSYRRKVVFLNFWATWCPPCRAELPSMERLYRRLQGNGVEMLAVSLDKKENSIVKRFVEQNGLTFTILHDREGNVGNLYGVRAIPTTFIINKEGIIREKHVGYRNWDDSEIANLIYSLINSHY